MKITLGILILVAAVFLVVAVLMQSGSSKRLSGSIAGAAETFFGKNKGKTVDKVLGRLTNVVAIIFAVLVLASFLVVNKAENTDEVTDDTAAQTTTTVAVSESAASTDSEAAVTTTGTVAVTTIAASAAEQ